MDHDARGREAPKAPDFSEPAFRPGIYRHFKGKRYRLLRVARHSETLEWMVVYQALYGDRGCWVRPAAMWSQQVLHQGQWTPRFAWEGSEADSPVP